MADFTESPPPRLCTSESTALAKDLAAAGGAGPSAQSLARIEAGLADVLGPGPGPGAGAAGAPSSNLAVIGGGVALAIAAGTLLFWPGSARKPTEALAPPAVVMTTEAEPSAPPPVALPDVAETTAEPALAAKPQRDVASPAPTEVQLLERARAALPGAPGRARRLLSRARALYPDGVFVQEREALEVMVLLARKRTAAARRAARSFAQRYPGSAHAARLLQDVEEADPESRAKAP